MVLALEVTGTIPSGGKYTVPYHSTEPLSVLEVWVPPEGMKVDFAIDRHSKTNTKHLQIAIAVICIALSLRNLECNCWGLPHSL